MNNNNKKTNKSKRNNKSKGAYVPILLSLLLPSYFVQGEPLTIEKWEQDRFAELDVDGNDILDNTEFRGTTRDWMTKAGVPEEKQIKETNKKHKQFDTNTDGVVSIEEFVTSNRKSNAANEKSKEKQAKTAPSSKEYLLNIGDAAPNYLGKDRQGDEVNVDELNGKIVIASFWVSWCETCKNELSILQNIQNQVGKDLLKVVAINYKESRLSYNKLKKQLNQFDITLTHDKRGKISKNFGVVKAPHLFIIDKKGKILFIDSEYNKTPVHAMVAVLKKELANN